MTPKAHTHTLLCLGNGLEVMSEGPTSDALRGKGIDFQGQVTKNQEAQIHAGSRILDCSWTHSHDFPPKRMTLSYTSYFRLN